MKPASSFPDLGVLLDRYKSDEKTRKAALHNAAVLRCIRGGLRIVKTDKLSFDPRGDYWRRPERRVLVAYFAKRWTNRIAPVAAVRTLALALFTHFDRARTEGVVSYTGVDYASAGGWPGICDALIAHAGRLGPIPAFDELRKVWEKLPATPSEHLQEFLRATRDVEDWSDKFEPGFKDRLPWFAYLGAPTQEEVLRRQRFFFGYANLLTTTNAYRNAGAQSFASVIQNTPTDDILASLERWTAGESPMKTHFMSLDAGDVEPRDRAEHAPVIELFGFLTLHRAPYYNKLAEVYREWLGLGSAENAYQLTEKVGEYTRAWLSEHEAARTSLASLFGEMLKVDLVTPVRLEAVDRPRAAQRAGQSADALVDAALTRELSALAAEELSALSAADAAACALHLLLDTEVYLRTVGPTEVLKEIPSGQGSSVATASPSPQPEVKPAEAVQILTLPATLRDVGDLALAYLHAGLHVLFAGAPGTGKTTLAQFVGYAWNRQLTAVPLEIPFADAPMTTVGNSAWSPFHTVGGLMPRKDGGFEAHAGIFIEPKSVKQGAWRLREGAIVLDEMNRADLDRCIGELYPLLSRSVLRVFPAGIPLVETIEASERFRLIATINDGTLDDIVFPISEGLARRFQRMELLGASRDEALSFVGVDLAAPASPRAEHAGTALREFFLLAGEHELLSKADGEERLPFGVGYFNLLRAWVNGSLKIPGADAEGAERATDLLEASLTTAVRSKKLTEIFRKLRSST